MIEVLTAAQMRAIEQTAIQSGAVTGAELMERAGAGVVAAILAEWPELAGPRQVRRRAQRVAAAAAPQRQAVVLCGPGNNGGDGFVVARLLHGQGWAVSVYLLGAPDRLPADARANHDLWHSLGEVGGLQDCTLPEGCDVVVDALFGIGMTRAFVWPGVAGEDAGAGEDPIVNRRGPRLVAVDIVSGIVADTGANIGPGWAADLTVTFHRPKLGHVLGEGGALTGGLRVVDIGLTGVPDNAARLIGLQGAGWALDKGGKRGAHKFSHGHALILSGGPGKGGAARLSARGALRIGAGLVTLGCPRDALLENAARLDAIMLEEIRGAEDLGRKLEDPRITALCLGPGLGVGERARWLTAQALETEAGVVLDADALTSFEGDPGTLFALSRAHGKVVMTPHGGEFARMFPDIAARLRDGDISKPEACREAALRAGAVVLLKGADTVIAAPDGACSLHSAHGPRAAPWLATAGAGDVLAGILTGLLARGFAPMQAAEAAVWLHVEAALQVGPGLIAEDLPDALPAVLRRVLAQEMDTPAA